MAEVFPSAFRHGVDERAIQYAVRNALVVEEIGDDPVRYLVLGPGRAGSFLELVVLDTPAGPTVIHAMAMRPRYQRLLNGR